VISIDCSAVVLTVFFSSPVCAQNCASENTVIWGRAYSHLQGDQQVSDPVLTDDNDEIGLVKNQAVYPRKRWFLQICSIFPGAVSDRTVSA
jgi:hypothetical protein